MCLRIGLNGLNYLVRWSNKIRKEIFFLGDFYRGCINQLIVICLLAQQHRVQHPGYILHSKLFPAQIDSRILSDRKIIKFLHIICFFCPVIFRPPYMGMAPGRSICNFRFVVTNEILNHKPIKVRIRIMIKNLV